MRPVRIDVTRRGDYAVRAMLALAQANGKGPLSARVIAERMDVPVRFMPHVLRDLARAGLVAGQTGRTGGYQLALEAKKITLLWILDAVESNHGAPPCVLRGGPCSVDGRCAVHSVFSSATSALRDQLAAASLAEVARALTPTNGATVVTPVPPRGGRTAPRDDLAHP
jgi:Rrf2 family protein